MMGTSVQNNDEFDFMTPQKGGGAGGVLGVFGRKKKFDQKKFFYKSSGPESGHSWRKKDKSQLCSTKTKFWDLRADWRFYVVKC